MRSISEEAKAYLSLYRPETYALEMPRSIADELMEAGLIEWVPSPSWAGVSYAITDSGKAYAREQGLARN